MKIARLVSSMLVLAAASLGVVSAGGSSTESANGGSFLHRVFTNGEYANSSANWSHLVSEYPNSVSSPMTDGNQAAVIFATHNAFESYGNHWAPFGVSYYAGKWGIFNHNGDHVDGGEAFNIQVQGVSDTVFVHHAFEGTITNNYTVLDHPLLNNRPGALLNVTPRGSSVMNPHYIGVYYILLTGRWAIFNQDMAAMPAGAEFNVHVLTDSDVSFIHTAETIVSTSMTEIDHPLLNDNSGARLIVTQNWGTGLTGIYNDNPIAVTFDNITKKWRIVNSDNTAMPEGAKFNVYIAGANWRGDGLMLNGGFEAALDNDAKQAITWDASQAGKGSKRVCNKHEPASNNTKIVSHTGECAFKFKGADGETRKLKQKAPIVTDIAGGSIMFSTWLKTNGVAGLEVKVKVKMEDGNKVKFVLPGDKLNGSYDWKGVGNALLLPPSNPVQIKVVYSLASSGKVFIDDAYSWITNF